MATAVVLIGLPGSGKSAYASNMKHIWTSDIEKWEICSSDKARESLYGDESIQGNPETVFKFLHNQVKEYLHSNINIIYDATNVNRKNRKQILKIGASIPNTKVEAHVVWAPLEVCIERDLMRNRTVGIDVIKKMLYRWETPFYDEGFDKIKIINTCDTSWSKTDYREEKWLAMDIPHNNPHHTLGVREHCIEAFDRADKYKYPEIVKVAAKWHDIGKPFTKFYKKDSEGKIIPHAHYYNHDNVGGYMSLGIDEYYLLENDDNLIEFSWLISNHMQPFFNSHYYQTLSSDLKEKIDQLHKCDLEAH